MRVSSIKSSPVRLNTPSTQPVKTAPDSTSGSGISRSSPSQVSASAGSLNLKAEIGLRTPSFDSSPSLQSTPTSIQSLNMDDLQILQDAEISDNTAKPKALKGSSFRFSVGKLSSNPAYVYSSSCPC